MRFVHPLSISQINFQIKVLGRIVLPTALHCILENGATIPPLLLDGAQVLPILLTPHLVGFVRQLWCIFSFRRISLISQFS
ncbi:hypothetical protein XELAEV_18000525mg [Xenopus laevis]|uniref:Uncharacterized protein n=1 Tax=Xenopus laevis TaxID=8355 RepID=A0A974BP55_XENLA|nr:hypothetical protein XELAEV_18000525mg [Xenopus laevis]